MKDIAKGAVYVGVFAVPFISLIVANTMFFPFITGKNFTFRIIVEIVFAAWIILALYEPAYRPKFSWILAGMSSLVAVMFFADLFGENRLMSFWSNFERMDGYVTLVHFYLYFLVVGSVLNTEKMWNRFFNTTLLSAVLLSLYAFAQLAGDITINQGGVRLDGTLGNAAYMAIYMFFHIFIAIFMVTRTKVKGLKYTYGALALLFIYLLLQTATRGTVLGLIGGFGLALTYVAFFTKGRPEIRKIAGGVLISLVVVASLLFAFRDASVIKDSPYLSRLTNISLSQGDIRFKVWTMAIEGFKERPILGWGQSNFSYIFNAEYNPSLYNAEPWYDRSHNIVFDWLVTGGILGFLAYFSILFATLYYLFYRPLRQNDESFTVLERAILIGLLAGYTFHNIFVFDNIISYIFYGTILAFIHARIAREVKGVQAWKADVRVVEQVIAPVVGIALVLVVYFVNVPGILAAGDIIQAFSLTAKSPEEALKKFDLALSRNSFGNQEIREQMTRQGQSVMQSTEASDAVKQKFFTRIEEELIKQTKESPNDARAFVFISSFYRMAGKTDLAIEQLKRARELSPNKQQIIFEQGFAYLQKKEYETATGYFKEAYDLDPTYMDARMYYAVGALYSEKFDLVAELISTPEQKLAFARNDLAIQAAYAVKQYDSLIEMLKVRIADKPDDAQQRASLAFVLNESGDKDGAVEVLNKAGEDIPSFKEQANQYIASILMENVPEGGSKPTVNVNGQDVKVSN